MPRVRPKRTAYQAAYKQRNSEAQLAYRQEYRKTHPKPQPTVIGIDGEGLTIEGEHLYTYIAAWTIDECVSTAENIKGLSAEECFEFLFALKRLYPNSLIAGFSLGYDYTKILESLPTSSIYRIARPESRRGKKHPIPIRWKQYSINYLRGRLTIARLVQGKHSKYCKGDECPGCLRGESVNVWDVWGFFQGSFIDACKNWGVITSEEYEYLKAMKLKRGGFTWKQWPTVKEYCGVECQKLAKLVTALRDAHGDADIPLKSYYGAGSTASAVLSKMGIKKSMPQGELPEALNHAVACSFFGGRFEINRYGPVKKTVHSYDIASAYPYQLTGLPCLACGRWRRIVKNIEPRIRAASAALVRYELPYTSSIVTNREECTSELPWGPFPLRTQGLGDIGHNGIDDGNIVYPATSGGGWCYRDEFLVGLAHWPNVVAKEAWIYETDCDHLPFKDVANLYIQRLQWGKEGRGIVVKLCANSIYGKLAQSIGDKPPFQCFLWAGMITSGCRAQLLELVAQGSVLMTATDGIVSELPLTLPRPRDTGTLEAATRAGKEPLGAWESKDIPGGIMLIRPGIAFPIARKENENEAEKETKARGIGKAVLKSHRDLVLESWEQHGARALSLQSDIFHGFKSSTRVSSRGYERSELFGKWSKRPQSVSYMPEPKRPFVVKDDGSLCTWSFGPKVKSAAYERIAGGETPKHILAMAAEKQLQSEQPDREEYQDEF